MKKNNKYSLILGLTPYLILAAAITVNLLSPDGMVGLGHFFIFFLLATIALWSTAILPVFGLLNSYLSYKRNGRGAVLTIGALLNAITFLFGVSLMYMIATEKMSDIQILENGSNLLARLKELYG